MNDKLYPIAALVKKGAGYELRIRWLLGVDRQELPRPDDSFDVRVRLTATHRYLDASGTFGAPGDVHTISVKPKNFAMVDPPRDTVPFPTDATRTWQVARKPTAPIDCGRTLGTPITGGFGICHLLSETQPSRMQARVERLLDSRVSMAMESLAARSPLPATDGATRELAAMIVRRAPRPIYLPRMLREQHAALVEHTAAQTAVAGLPDDQLFAFGGGSLAQRWQRAAVTFEVLRDRALIEALDETVTPPTQLRQQVRMRALQGGTLLDFWCSPETGDPACGDAGRGRVYPASELIGTGLTIGNFSAADLQQWLEAVAGGGTAVEIEVRHLRTLDERVVTNGDGEVLDVLTDEDLPFDPGLFPLLATDVRAALDGDSSLPPAAPREARVNYDFLQTNAGTEGPVQLGYVTGDAHVEIDITPGSQSSFNKTVFGFNVYGMWETQGTKPFFDDPQMAPTLGQLRPWLITRKYSYERDLKGAFPSSSGVHPALQRAIDEPSWQPALLRPTAVTSSDPATGETTLPDVFRFTADQKPQTRFNLDLRVGMDSGVEAETRRFLLWDRDAPIKVTWDPTRSRDGATVTAPQRYRFWVTAVDAFEQESTPVAVLAHDADAGAGLTTLFSPRRRASLLPPPAADVNAQLSGRTLTLAPGDDGGFIVTVQWDTPFLNDLGRRDDGQTLPRRADRQQLVGAVKLFRRRLRHKVAETEMFSFAAPRAETGTFSLPQWIAAIHELTAEGWAECGAAKDIAPPAGDDIWKQAFPFAHGDRGFEYRALVAMAVAPQHTAFWMPDVHDARRAVIAVQTGERWEAVTSRVTETPRSTAVVGTEGWKESDGTLHPGALPVPNVAAPRGAVLVKGELCRAKPVLPPPGIARDAVLLRLLTRAVGIDAPIEPQPWADTGIALTIAQAAMLEAALERAATESGIVDVVGDPRLRDARRILAGELVAAPDDGRAYRQNLTVGFRGLAGLRWQYTPFAATPPSKDEAEAEKVRVHAVRVPQDDAAADRYATVRAAGRRSGDTWTLSAIAAQHQAGLDAIEQFQQPALVRVTAQGNVVYGVVSELKTQDGGIRLKVAGTGAAPLPEEAEIALFAAQPMLDRSVDTVGARVEETIYLPVGGGHAEIFGYWLQTISAQERVSGYAATPFFFFAATPTIEPEPPLAFRVNLPANSTDDFALDPVVHRDWLPREIGAIDLARHNPRVVVSWNAYDPDDEIGIEVEREERLVERQMETRDLLTVAISPWEAIKAIDKLADGALLHPDWIGAIRGGWLLGEAVDVSAVDRGEVTALLIPVSVTRPLSGAEGLKVVRIPGVETAQPAFIDYFRQAGNTGLAMDGNYEYRYRLRAYIDVLNPLPPDVEPGSRILRSQATPWSEWILPEPTGASLVPDAAVVLTDNPQDTPAVRLQVDSGAAPFLARDAGPTDGWFYRVTVRRVLEFALPSTEQTKLEPRWKEIGMPLVVLPGSPTVEMTDSQIERAEVDQPVTVKYQITARQLVVTPSRRERLVRTLDDVTVTIVIPPPADPEGKERMATKRIGIL